MKRRRILLAVSALGAALLTGCAGMLGQTNPAGTFHIDPSDPYAELKKYKSAVNMLTARLTVSFQHLFSIGELYKEGPRGDEIMNSALKDIRRLHAELAKYLPKAPDVRKTIDPTRSDLLNAFDVYVQALAGVAGIDYGDISQERIDALVKAGSDMEPLIP